MKDKIMVGIIVLVALVLGYLIVTQLILHRNVWNLQPAFEVGKCYQMVSRDPFSVDVTTIKVLAIKKGYIQYVYWNPDEGTWSINKWSASILLYQGIYNPVPCEECK